ncbi:MAG TPA: hypothetical protein VIY48_12915, partial [Candidatus Paceibacterota bacterium]
ATSDNSIYNGKHSGWNYQSDARLTLTTTPVQLILSRVVNGATTTLDQTPAADACGNNWCAGAAAATDGYSAAGGNPPMPVTMERIDANTPGINANNWASADGYSYYANDFNQQRIIGTPYNPNSNHWPMVGFVCDGDSSVMTPGNTYTYHPASNNCHFLSGYVGRDWDAQGVLLRGTVGSSTEVTRATGRGPYKDMMVGPMQSCNLTGASSSETYTVVFYNYNNNVGGQYNAYNAGDMMHYLQYGTWNDGSTTDPAPYPYQSLSFVIQ